MNVTYFDPNQAHAAESTTAGVRVHWHYLRWGVGVFTVVLSMVYLIMLNGLATQGFDLESLKADQLALHKEMEAVDIGLAIPSSIYALESNELIQGLPLAEDKQFLAIEADHWAAVMEQGKTP